jgi:ribosomal-protein-alanine N-acetyltransferase
MGEAGGIGVLRCAQDDGKNRQRQKQTTARTSDGKDKKQIRFGDERDNDSGRELEGVVVRVRAAEVADLEGVLEIERGAATAPHWAAAEYAACLGAAERRVLLVAESEGRVVGFAVGAVMVLGDTVVGELESVAVEEAARRSGIGAALCGAVVAWCAGKGAMEVELEVRAGSAGAMALYGRLGFVAVGRRPGYYRSPVEDAVLMRLEVGSGEGN